MLACKNSGFNIDDCLPEAGKSITSGKGRKNSVIDYRLTRRGRFGFSRLPLTSLLMIRIKQAKQTALLDKNS
jgi:hypothetical protein